jgi:hypothetical protein
MFVNKSDVVNDTMLTDDVKVTDIDMDVDIDVNVTEVYNDTFGVEADSRVFVGDVEDNHHPRAGGYPMPRPLPGFLQVKNTLILFFIILWPNLFYLRSG